MAFQALGTSQARTWRRRAYGKQQLPRVVALRIMLIVRAPNDSWSIRAKDNSSTMCVRTIFMAAVQPIRTVQDLLAHAITTWVQPATICLPVAEGIQGNSLKVTLCETDSKRPIPMPLFEYELELLVKEGTAAGGRKCWLRARDEPKGSMR